MNGKAWLVMVVAVFVVAGSMTVLAADKTSNAKMGSGGLYGGTLRVALNGPVPSVFDPRSVSDDASWNVFYRVFDTLVVIDKTTGEPVPWMIKTLNGAYSSNKVTVTLKDGIRWHNSNPVTGQDVKATFTNSALKNNIRFKDTLSHITSVDVTGTNTIIFNLDAPYAPFYNDVLAKVPILPQGYAPADPIGSGPFVYKSKTSTEIILEKNPNYFNTETGGPYVDFIYFRSFTGANVTKRALTELSGSELFTLNQTNYKKYLVNGTADKKLTDAFKSNGILLSANAQVTVVVENNSGIFVTSWVIDDRVTADGKEICDNAYVIESKTSDKGPALHISSGKNLDYVMWGVSPEDTGPGISVVITEDFGFYYMAFNMNHAVLNDKTNSTTIEQTKELRHALAMCIDKKTTVVSSIKNFGTVGSAVVSKGNSLWFNDNVQNDYAYIHDVTGDGKVDDADVTICLAPVSENLTKANYVDVNADGRRELPGSSYPGNVKLFNITALVPSSSLSPSEDTATSSVVTNMRAAGINVKDSVFEDYATRDTKVESGNFDVYFARYDPPSSDPSYIYSIFHSNGNNNTAGYSNPAVDAKIESADKEMDLAKRQVLVDDIQSLIAQDNPWSIVYYPFKIESAESKDFEGWVSMTGGVGNVWTFLSVHKPMLGSLTVSVEVAGGNAVLTGSKTNIKVTVKSGVEEISNASILANVTKGSLSNATGVTDVHGMIMMYFQAPSVTTTETVTLTVRAQALQYMATEMSTVYITVSPPSGEKLKVVATTDMDSVSSEDPVQITVKVTNENGTLAIKDANVTLEILYLSASGTTITPSSANTNANGEAVFEFKAKVDTDTLYRVKATVTKGGWLSGGDTAQVQVTGKPAGSDIPMTDALGIVTAIALASGIFTVVRRRKEE